MATTSMIIAACIALNLFLFHVAYGWTTATTRWGKSISTSASQNHGHVSTPCRPMKSFASNHAQPSAPLYMSFLNDLGDIMTGGKLVPQDSLPYNAPLGDASHGLSDETRSFAIEERLASFTGEDFDVWDLDQERPYCVVRGAMLHLPGKDKMRIRAAADPDGKNGGAPLLAVLDRKLVALKPTYEIYRGDNGKKLGWLEKDTLAWTHTFEFYGGPFQKPAYRLEGDFADRRIVMKNANGEVVAKMSKDRFLEFEEFNHYQVQVAPGMDPILVLACACAIDEEFDKESREAKP